MLVSHRYRFIYTKTLKTGGTSVESYFERFCMPEAAWTESHFRDEQVSEAGIIGFRGLEPPAGCQWWNHMPAADIRQRLGEKLWQSYYKFCVIRNPFEKVVSAFYFFRRMQEKALEFDSTAEAQAAFESWLGSGAQLPVDRDKYVINGQFCLDTVLRYESLHQDLEKLCERLSLPWDPAALPGFKTGIRPRSVSTAALYSPRAREIVETVFAPELAHQGYSFPEGG